MRGLMKLAGVAWLDCGRSTQEFTSYMAGFAYPLRSHLRLDDQHAAQSPCLAILVPLGMRCIIDNKLHLGSGGWPHPYPCSTGPDHAAVHPFRRDAPVTSHCTRSEGVQCLRIGCTASSTTSLHVGLLAGAGHAGVRQARAVQRCTRYSSNALDRRALHYLLSSATLC